MDQIVTQAGLDRRGGRWLSLVLALTLACQPLALVAQDQVMLPDLGGRMEVLPPDQARSFPNEFRNFMRAQGMLVEDPVVDSYFTEMGYRLVMHSTGRRDAFHFHVLNVPGINAFAAPAGVVALNGGLILAAESADEVAGVLAHEIAHVTQSHLSRGMEEARSISIPVMLATLGLVMAGGLAGGMDPDVAQGILATGQGIAQQAQINYTRQNEAEADRIGIQLLVKAGYNPSGMADFFNTLNRWSRSQGSGPPEYLRTHPLTVSRVAEARERAERLSPVRRLPDPRFELVRARLRVAMSPRPEQASEYFRDQLQQGVANEAAARYGLALALIEARRTVEAEEHVRWLLDHDPHDQLFRILRGDLLLAQNRGTEALETYQQLYMEYGRSRLVSLAYANALLRQDGPDFAAEAADVLNFLMQRDPADVRVSEMLARAADRAGKPVLAGEAVATNYYHRGGLPQAIEQLERVLEREDLDYYDRARISAKLDQMRAEHLRQLAERGR